MAVMGGWKIFTRNAGKPGMEGGWFYNREMGKALYIVGRGVPTLLFYEDPPTLPTPPHFSNFVTHPSPPPLPCHLQPPPTLIFLLPCFFGWIGDHATFDVLFYLKYGSIHVKPWYLDVCFMQQGVKFTEVWNMWVLIGTLIWYHTHKQTHKHTQNTQGTVD